jgi:DNA-binding transcriptional MerR regulator
MKKDFPSNLLKLLILKGVDPNSDNWSSELAEKTGENIHTIRNWKERGLPAKKQIEYLGTHNALPEPSQATGNGPRIDDKGKGRESTAPIMSEREIGRLEGELARAEKDFRYLVDRVQAVLTNIEKRDGQKSDTGQRIIAAIERVEALKKSPSMGHELSKQQESK